MNTFNFKENTLCFLFCTFFCILQQAYEKLDIDGHKSSDWPLETGDPEDS